MARRSVSFKRFTFSASVSTCSVVLALGALLSAVATLEVSLTVPSKVFPLSKDSLRRRAYSLASARAF